MADNDTALSEPNPTTKNNPFIYNTISRETSSFWQELVYAPLYFTELQHIIAEIFMGDIVHYALVLLTVTSARIRDIREKTAHGGGVCCRLDADDATPIHISTGHRYINDPPLKSLILLISNLSVI